jgi:phosphoribosyl 1,2-cyclic phosphodiesterase
MDDSPQIHNLASGSSGNVMLVRYRGATALIDAGLPIRKLTDSLKQLGTHPSNIDFVFITHEHSDHVRSLPQLRRLGVAIITSPGTARGLSLRPNEYSPALPWKTRSLAGIELTPIPVSHDALEPMGVMLSVGDSTVTVMTDLGCVTPDLVEPLCAATTIVLEANHDVEMLRCGPYPHYLKRRVLSRHGHLSNADCGAALHAVQQQGPGPAMIWLAHLSVTNNLPQMAVATVADRTAGVPVAALPRHDAIDLLHVPQQAFVSTSPLQPRLWFDP